MKFFSSNLPPAREDVCAVLRVAAIALVLLAIGLVRLRRRK
jgi:hypothetical protein